MNHCHSCGYRTENLKILPYLGGYEDIHLCIFCGRTLIGLGIKDKNFKVLSSMGWIANWFAEKLELDTKW